MFEGFDILEYLTVASVKFLGGCVECLELFWVSREICFSLRGGLSPPVRLVSGSPGGGGVDRFDGFSLSSCLSL